MKNPLKNHEIEQIFLLAIKAGEIAKHAFLTKNFLLSTKDDNSEITSTDIAISRFLLESLSAIFPRIPVISEEDSLSELSCDSFFLIDPIDGTASFAKGCDQFSINISLIHNKKAVFGLLYAPIFEGGNLIFNNSNNELVKFTPQNGQKIILKKNLKIRNSEKNNLLAITTSLRSETKDISDFMAQLLPSYIDNYSLRRLSSAIKFFGIIEDKHQLYLHFRRSMEWDTAAGQILVELSGGSLHNLSKKENSFFLGESHCYQKPEFVNSAFIATSYSFKQLSSVKT